MQNSDSKLLLLSSELLTAQESVSRALGRPCPFCNRDYEDTFEIQQHAVSHLEAVALLSVLVLDEDKKSGEGIPNSDNMNRAESKAGDFDFTEVLVFPDDEAEKLAVKTELGILNQSFDKPSSESVRARSRDWLDGVHAGPNPLPLPRSILQRMYI